MHLHLDGSTSINADRKSVFSRLTDPKFLATTLPDAENVSFPGENQLEARMKLRIAVVSSTLSIKMTIAEKTPESRARLLAVASGSGSTVSIDSVFELTGDRPTSMAWSADADVGGVMAGMGSSILKGFATKKVAEIFGGITKAIESGA